MSDRDRGLLRDPHDSLHVMEATEVRLARLAAPWSVVRIHYLHHDNMRDALSYGWQPFATIGKFVLLRRLSRMGPTAGEYHVTYGEWHRNME